MILDDDKQIEKRSLEIPLTLKLLEENGWLCCPDVTGGVAIHPSGYFKVKLVPVNPNSRLFGMSRNIVNWFRLRPEVRVQFDKYQDHPDAVALVFKTCELFPWSPDQVELYVFTVDKLAVIDNMKDLRKIQEDVEMMLREL